MVLLLPIGPPFDNWDPLTQSRVTTTTDNQFYPETPGSMVAKPTPGTKATRGTAATTFSSGTLMPPPPPRQSSIRTPAARAEESHRWSIGSAGQTGGHQPQQAWPPPAFQQAPPPSAEEAAAREAAAPAPPRTPAQMEEESLALALRLQQEEHAAFMSAVRSPTGSAPSGATPAMHAMDISDATSPPADTDADESLQLAIRLQQEELNWHQMGVANGDEQAIDEDMRQSMELAMQLSAASPPAVEDL